jgi:acetyl esterase/lipase
MSFSLQQLKELVVEKPPELHPAWAKVEEELKRSKPSNAQPLSPLERQPIYAQECRELLAKVTAPGSRDQSLSQGVLRTEFTIPSSADGFPIPVLQLEKVENHGLAPEAIVVYYHGGGLHVGEADSEEFSCRRIIKSTQSRIRLYSIGYRLMPTYPASVCVSDALDGFRAVSSKDVKNIVIGSSSGGQLAATVCQTVTKDSVHGLLLRCPVTCDPAEEKKYVPQWLRPFHTTYDTSFVTFLFQLLKRAVPRDGLKSLPLEATKEELAGYPRTWIQLCTNDSLYSDGLCHAMALVDAGVEVRGHVLQGWPHTFWLKVPDMEEAFEADQSMMEGLEWLLL